MTRDNLLFVIIGVLLGFILGFIFSSTMNQRYGPGAPAPIASNQNLPADHPPIQPGDTQNPQAIFAQVQASMKKAREEPNNFDAQVDAAKLEYQIQRYDQAVEFLIKANQLKPDDYDVIAMLGAANLESAHYDMAEKWYKIALARKPDDVGVLAGLAYMQLQKVTPTRLRKRLPIWKKSISNQDLPQFRDKLAGLKSTDKPK